MAKKKEIENENKLFNLDDYKKEIDAYIKERVEIESASQSVKVLKKQLKNKKISGFIKSLIILCLLGCIGYGVYYLYNDGYFDDKDDKPIIKYVNNCDTKIKDVKEEENKLPELIEKYSYLLDNINFDANSNYTYDYYNGNLTNEIKLYLAYKNIDEKNIMKDDDSIILDSGDLADSYKELFNEDAKLTTFKYNNAQFKYLEQKNMFVASSTPNEDKKITRDIIDIKIEGKNIIITTVEGYINDSKLYNILTNKEVPNFKVDNKISDYKNKLNVVNYVFNNEYLVNLKK